MVSVAKRERGALESDVEFDGPNSASSVVLNRGFRQATRGPDTGAFHHPLFRRDKPELCLDMVCQRSRDRKSAAKNTISKKQKLSSRHLAPLTQDSLKAIDNESAHTPSRTVATVSVTDDSRSETSSAESNLSFTSHSRIPKGVTNNKEFVQASIHQRDQMERIRVAKAMLYQSFLKAWQEGN